MPEGVAAGGKVLSGAVHDDPARKPEPGAEAPRGYTWDRPSRSWKPKVKGKLLWQSEGAAFTDLGDSAGDVPVPGDVDHGAQRDPQPSWLREDDKPGGGGRKSKLRWEDVPGEVKDDIAGLAGLIGAPIIAAIQQVDPYCGGALAQCFEGAVDAALPLICRSSKIVKYFTEDQSDWLLWGKLAMALVPFGQAVMQHHVVRSVEVVRDKQGVPHVQPRARGAQPADHLQPQAQPEHYAA